MSWIERWQGIGWGTAVSILFLLLFLPPPTTAQTTPTMTPTPDRLAAPPTVAAPTQADEGAQLYWLHCQPCHGDRGQGLTDAADDDWRAQYPPEDAYCWESGCHGERPYEDGFTLPRTIPAVVGEDSLKNYAHMGAVYAFMRGAMPRQAPASLTDAEYLAIAAFLVRARGLSDGGGALTEAELSTMVLNGAYMEVTLTEGVTTMPPAASTVAPNSQPDADPNLTGWWIGGLVILILFAGGVLWLRHGR